MKKTYQDVEIELISLENCELLLANSQGYEEFPAEEGVSD